MITANELKLNIEKLNLLCIQHRECTLEFRTTIIQIANAKKKKKKKKKISQHILLETWVY